MEYFAIAYRSTAVNGLTPAALDHLLVDSRAHNRMAGVTGVLLYDGQHFLQYLEGTSAGVRRIYERIVASRHHVELQLLQHGPAARRFFPQWYMGCHETGGSVLQKLSSQQWRHEAAHLRDEAGASAGLRQLLAFWERQDPHPRA
ncbi:BLUF domain-containing protein [Stenotrophomonas sp. YIM B06876]|uniref:BLUF domain-containing protein n=1 Tax=Stenotrophomonas sp. YIM B06876 TaxID=3060211 RepID=UPI002739D3B9|nr:BLUF domain-containing protein [Stenotrophomonas sp. YIM B06876]